MVEVFKTNVQYEDQSLGLKKILLNHFPNCQINFDLEDCDKILRIEGKHINLSEVTKIVIRNGFTCEVLLD